MQTRKIIYDFRGALAPPAVASRQGIWCSKATGDVTIKSVSGGSMDLTLVATSEVQNGCLYMGDILPFDIDDLIRVEFIAKLSASFHADNMATFGMIGARHDTIDTIAQAAVFRAIGSNAIYLETDDGTTDIDDKATGLSLVATYKRFVIDFSVGNTTLSPPSLSKGGTSDVKFFMSNDRGALTQVGKNVKFDMSAYTGNLQLFAQIQKASGTTTGTLSLLEASVEYRLAP